MSNAWGINVKTCADCPLQLAWRCEATRFMPYLADRPALDIFASLAGAPPPDGCPLENGEMRIEIRLDRSAWRCTTCGQAVTACPAEVWWDALCHGRASESERETARAACRAHKEQRDV